MSYNNLRYKWQPEAALARGIGRRGDYLCVVPIDSRGWRARQQTKSRAEKHLAYGVNSVLTALCSARPLFYQSRRGIGGMAMIV